MKLTCLLAVVLPALLLASPAALADIESGPKPGEKVTPLKVHAVVGPVEDKEIDYAAERKDKPTVYVFVQAATFDRPIGRYLKALDKAVGELGKDTYIVAIWLTDDEEKTKNYLPRMNQSIKLAATALTYFAAKEGPADWAVNERASLTSVVVKGGKVLQTFSYVSTNDTDVPKVMEALKKAVEEKK